MRFLRCVPTILQDGSRSLYMRDHGPVSLQIMSGQRCHPPLLCIQAQVRAAGRNRWDSPSETPSILIVCPFLIHLPVCMLQMIDFPTGFCLTTNSPGKNHRPLGPAITKNAVNFPASFVYMMKILLVCMV